jgi:hypothetical protein
MSAIITTKSVAMTSESCKRELQDVFRNADNNNRESTYTKYSHTGSYTSGVGVYFGAGNTTCANR